MKAISLWQPWASLWVAPDAKIHETRSWPTRHRGELAVHASKHAVCELMEGSLLASVQATFALGGGYAQHLPRGAIIGVVNLEDCYLVDTVRDTTMRDVLFGNWTPGRYAWRRGPVVRVLPTPVPCRGLQGLWTVPADVERLVRAQL